MIPPPTQAPGRMVITKNDIRKWVRQNKATLIGRSFETGKPEDEEQFVDWFFNIIQEIKELRRAT